LESIFIAASPSTILYHLEVGWPKRIVCYFFIFESYWSRLFIRLPTVCLCRRICQLRRKLPSFNLDSFWEVAFLCEFF
jgi:hypothetical protein